MNATERRLDECQRIIGYYFSNPELLEIALTHSSLRAPDRECNERLEFLGDSILGLVITEELYHLLPDQSEGELTRIKSSVVSRTALLSASQRLDLAKYAEFARGVGKRDKLPASVVANLVEAVIGAIYLDAGYYPAREFVLRHMSDSIDDELNDRGAKNYKSLLQHEVQQAVSMTPTYRTVEAEGPDHAKEFVVAAIIRGQEWGRAIGSTKKEAEQEAARRALEAWGRRGRGRRRRRRRRGEDADAAPVEPPAVDEVDVDEVAVEEAAPVAEPEAVSESATATAGEAEPARRRRPRRRGRRRGGSAAETVEPAAEAPAAEEPAAEPVEAGPTEKADDAAAPARRPRRRRRRGARSEDAARSEETAPAEDAAPVETAPVEEASVEEASVEEAPAAEPKPAAKPRPAPEPKPARKKTASAFGKGIDLGEEKPARRPRRKKAAAKESVTVEAPARAAAPVKRKSKPADTGGFGAGILEDE